MIISEKGFLEKLASAVPGLGGYRERESRRETDRRLREYLARRLDDTRGELNALRRSLTDAGFLPLLALVGRLDGILQKCAAGLRYADSGYSGLFDPLKIREQELDLLCEYDAALLDEVHGLGETVRSAGHSTPGPQALAAIVERAGILEQRIARRRDLFEGPKP